jgi:hypothetical protein
MDDNVIRLPTDWLGSRDELVPIAPRHDSPGDEAFVEPVLTSADTFWSEEAGSLHDAVQAPRAPEKPLDTPPVAAATGEPVAAGGPSLRPARLRLRWPVLAAGLVILALIVVGAFIGGQPQHGAARAPRQTAAIAPSTTSGSPSASAGVLTRARLLTSRRSGDHGGATRGRPRKLVRRAHHSARRPVAQRARHPHRTILHPESTAGRSDSSVTPSAPATPAAPAVSDGASGSASASSAPAGSASSAGSYSPPAHPVAASPSTSGGSAPSSGQPAFGSGGMLGPGTSPDS